MTLYDKLKDKETLNNYKFDALKQRIIKTLKENESLLLVSLLDASLLLDVYQTLKPFTMDAYLNLFNE